MTKPKTLNDIETWDSSSIYWACEEVSSSSERVRKADFIDKNILKAEAIKWIKEDINREIEIFNNINCPMTLHDILTGDEDIKDNQILKWMERFNLTEEDLK